MVMILIVDKKLECSSAYNPFLLYYKIYSYLFIHKSFFIMFLRTYRGGIDTFMLCVCIESVKNPWFRTFKWYKYNTTILVWDASKCSYSFSFVIIKHYLALTLEIDIMYIHIYVHLNVWSMQLYTLRFIFCFMYVDITILKHTKR